MAATVAAVAAEPGAAAARMRAKEANASDDDQREATTRWMRRLTLGAMAAANSEADAVRIHRAVFDAGWVHIMTKHRWSQPMPDYIRAIVRRGWTRALTIATYVPHVADVNVAIQLCGDSADAAKSLVWMLNQPQMPSATTGMIKEAAVKSRLNTVAMRILVLDAYESGSIPDAGLAGVLRVAASRRSQEGARFVLEMLPLGLWN